MKVSISVIEQYCCNRVFALYSPTFQSNLKPAHVCITKISIFKTAYSLKGCLVFFFQGAIPASENNGLLKSLNELNKLCLKNVLCFSSIKRQLISAMKIYKIEFWVCCCCHASKPSNFYLYCVLHTFTAPPCAVQKWSTCVHLFFNLKALTTNLCY